MKIVLNTEQTKLLSGFFSNMAIAWFVVALINATTITLQIRFITYAILSLYYSLFLLRDSNLN